MPYTKLRYHIVTTTKNRLPLIITPETEVVIYKAMRVKALDLKCKIIAIGNTEDHLHLVVAVRSSVTLCDFIRDTKASSSLAIRKSGLVENFKWQKSYGAFTVDPGKMEGLIQYVLNQKWNHKHNKLWEHYEKTT